MSLSHLAEKRYRETLLRFSRYAIVGILSNVLGYGAYLLITWMGGGSKATMTLLYAFGTGVAFFGNRTWAFQHRGRVPASLWRFAVAYLAGYAINFLMLVYFFDHLHIPHQLVQIGAIVVVAAFLFLVLSSFVFVPPSEGEHVADRMS